MPSVQVQAIIVEGERGAARIAELSHELAARTADVARCRADLIVARRLSELLRLRREVHETPARIDTRVDRLRAGTRRLAARLQGANDAGKLGGSP